MREYMEEGGDKGGLWGQINSAPSASNLTGEVSLNGIWKKVGRGNSTLFWEHRWIGETTLKEMFPRISISPTRKNASL